MQTEQTESPRLYRQIADRICSKISGGEIAPGGRLPAERILAEQFGISRQTVREALIVLEVEGWVEIRGGSGVFASERAPFGVNAVGISAASGVQIPGPFEVLDARSVIEPEIASLAAKNATESQIESLSNAFANMAICLAGDPMHVEYDRRFHSALAEASGNNALALSFHLLWSIREAPLYRQLEVHFHTEAIWQRLILEHREILAAVKSRDQKAARTAMKKHIKTAKRRFKSNWQEGQ